MLDAGNKCWARSMKKWLFKNQPQEVAIMPLVQPPLKMAPYPTTTHVLQVEELAMTRALQVKEPTTAHAL